MGLASLWVLARWARSLRSVPGTSRPGGIGNPIGSVRLRSRLGSRREEGLVERPVLDQVVREGQEQPAMAQRVGVIVPGGDRDLARVVGVESAGQVEYRDRVVGGHPAESRDRLGA